MIVLFVLISFTLLVLVLWNDEKKHRKIMTSELLLIHLQKTLALQHQVVEIPDEYSVFKQIISGLLLQAKNRTTAEYVDFLFQDTKKVDNSTKELLLKEIEEIIQNGSDASQFALKWYLTTCMFIYAWKKEVSVTKVDKELEDISVGEIRKEINDLCVA